MQNFEKKYDMIWLSCVINILLLFFIVSGFGGASFANPEQERAIAADDLPSSPFWPPYAGDRLSWLGSLEYEIPGQESPNIRKISIRPKLSDDDLGWFYETYYIDIASKEYLLSKEFYASHGSFQASVPLYLWGERYEYVLLIRQITKGTGVSEHQLDVYEVKNGVIQTVLEKNIAGYFDFFGNLWHYKLFVTPTEIEPVNSYYGLELRLEREFANEEFVRKGFVSKDVVYGQDMPEVVCIIYYEEKLHEYNGKRCQDISKLE